jgi:hypothetical protein
MIRADALTVTCPKCGAPPHMPCMGKRAARKACHVERHRDCWGGRKAPPRPPSKRGMQQGWIYLMLAKGAKAIKIGFSTKYPSSRKRTLQTGNPHELKLLMLVQGTLRDEQRYHEQFAHLRIRGEWFKDCPEIRDFFREMA